MTLKELFSKRISFATPFINATILRKDLTRFMGLWIAYCVMTLMGLSGAADDAGYLLWELTGELSSGGIINGTFALVVGLCLFGDLYNHRLCNALHALPVRREAWLATHLLAAGIFWVVPFATRALFYMLVLGENSVIALIWLLGMAAQYLFYLSLAALCAVCAGTRVGMAAMYGLINFGSMLCYGFATTVYEPLLIGIQISDKPFLLFSPIAYLMDNELIQVTNGPTYRFERFGDGWWYIGVMCALAVGLIALAVVAYRRRNLEAAGEMVVFRGLKKVVWWLLTLTAGIVVHAMGLLMDQTIASLIVGLVLGGMVSELLMHRNAKCIPKGLAKGAGVAAVIGFTMLIASIDPLGITRWQPKVEDVESVTISDYFYYDGTPHSYGRYLVRTTPDSIENIIHAHSLLIEEGVSTESLWETEAYDSIHITYKLKNGTEKIRRYYYLRDSDAGNAVAPLWSEPQFVLGYTNWGQFLLDNTSVSIQYSGREYVLNTIQTRNLLQTIKLDCENGTWQEGSDNDIQIQLEDGTYLTISKGCTLTTAWLKTNLPQLYN